MKKIKAFFARVYAKEPVRVQRLPWESYTETLERTKLVNRSAWTRLCAICRGELKVKAEQ